MSLEIMDQAKLADELVAVYTDLNNTTKFEVGYIVDFDENYYILKRVSPQGEDDGYLLGKTKYIYRVELDTLYLKKMLKLIKYYGITRQKTFFEHDDLLLSFMKFAYQDKKIMSIELFESENQDIVGYVSKFNSDNCTVMQITESGDSNGYSICNLADISFIVYNSEDQKVLEILNNT